MPVFHQGFLSMMNEQNVPEVLQFIKKQKAVLIATQNPTHTPRITAMMNLKIDSLDRFYFVSRKTSTKVQNILQHPDVEIVYQQDTSACIFSGIARIREDKELKESLWQPWMENLFPEKIEDESYCVIEFVPDEARIMID